MSVSVWIYVTVVDHDPTRETQIVAAVQRWISEEDLDSGVAWSRPRIVPSSSGRQIHVDSIDSVILSGSSAWQRAACERLRQRVAAVAGAPCGTDLDLDYGADEDNKRRPGTAILRHACDRRALAVLAGAWDDKDAPSYAAAGCGPAQHEALVEGYRLLPDRALRAAWVWLVVSAPTVRDAVLWPCFRDFLEGPVGERLSGEHQATIFILESLDGSDAWESFYDKDPARLERIARAVAGGATVEAARLSHGSERPPP